MFAPPRVPRSQLVVLAALTVPTLPRTSQVPPRVPATVAEVTTVPVAVVVLVSLALKLPASRVALLPVVVSVPNFWAVRLTVALNDVALALPSAPTRVRVELVTTPAVRVVEAVAGPPSLRRKGV